MRHPVSPDPRDRRLPDPDWTRPPAGATRSVFSAPSGELAVWTMGDPAGPRVLLVPGVTGSKEDFLLVMPELAAAGCLVQSYDLAGQYESADAGPERLRPPRERYDYRLFVDDLVAFIEDGAAGARPVHLLGYSFAGIVAEMLVAERPELVASLMLLSTPPVSGQVFRRVRVIGPFADLLNGKGVAALVRWGVVRNFQRVGPRRLRFVTDRFAVTRESSRGQIMDLMMHAPDREEALRSSGIPIALAVGVRDLWPLRLHRRFAERIGAELLLYPTGHGPCEATPYQLSRDLLALIRRAA